MEVFFDSGNLLKLLSADGKLQETFYLSEKYSEALAFYQKQIKNSDAKLKSLKRKE